MMMIFRLVDRTDLHAGFDHLKGLKDDAADQTTECAIYEASECITFNYILSFRNLHRFGICAEGFPFMQNACVILLDCRVWR
jgi:hypothetical protein